MPETVYKVVMAMQDGLCSVAAPGLWEVWYEPDTWAYPREGSQLFAFDKLEPTLEFVGGMLGAEVWVADAIDVTILPDWMNHETRGADWSLFWAEKLNFVCGPAFPPGTVTCGAIKLRRHIA